MTLLEDTTPRMRVVFAIGGLAIVWIGFQFGALDAIMSLVGGAGELVIGLGVLAILGFFAISEAEDDDSAGDVVGKTADRIDDATDGLLDGVSALILGVVAIVLTIGGQMLDLLGGLADLAGQSPLVAGQLATIGVGALGALGQLSVTGVVVGGVALLLVGLVWRRR